MTLEELKKVAEAATPGPWCTASLGEEAEGFAYVVNGDKEWFEVPKERIVAPVYYDYECAAVRVPDARFIATFNPEMVKKLLAVVEAADLLRYARKKCSEPLREEATRQIEAALSVMVSK